MLRGFDWVTEHGCFTFYVNLTLFWENNVIILYYFLYISKFTYICLLFGRITVLNGVTVGQMFGYHSTTFSQYFAEISAHSSWQNQWNIVRFVAHRPACTFLVLHIFFSSVMRSSILWSHPVPSAKEAHSMTMPLLCFSVGVNFSGLQSFFLIRTE